jgi:hypothetical protein
MKREGWANAVIGYLCYMAAAVFALWVLSSLFPAAISDRNDVKGLVVPAIPIFAAIGAIAILIIRSTWRNLKARIVRSLKSKS